MRVTSARLRRIKLASDDCCFMYRADPAELVHSLAASCALWDMACWPSSLQQSERITRRKRNMRRFCSSACGADRNERRLTIQSVP